MNSCAYPHCGCPVSFPKGYKPSDATECPMTCHLDFIRSLPCLKCGKAPSEAAHVRYSDARAAKVNPGFGAKPEDRWSVPLCASCHRGLKGQHSRGEYKFWTETGIDPIFIALALWGVTGSYEDGCQIVRHAYFHS